MFKVITKTPGRRQWRRSCVFIVNLYKNFEQLNVSWVFIWFNGWKPFAVSHNVAKFSSFKNSESGDKIFSVCHVISTTTCLKGKKMFGVRAPPNHHTVKLDGHRHSSSKDITPLVYQMILPDHEIKESCEFMGRNSLPY